MKKIFLIILFMEILSYSEIIELKDGTKINGTMEGLIDNVYMVRTQYGMLSIKKEDILNPASIKISEIEKDSQTVSNIDISSQSAIDTININEKSQKFEFKTIISSSAIEKIFFKNDIIIATRTYNDKNELIKMEGNLEDGKYIEYYDSGTVKSEINISSNMENGSFKIFYENGNLKTKAEYKNALIDGDAYFYSPDGKLLLQQSYKMGLLDGPVIEYDLNGNIVKKETYIQGNLLKKIEEPKENKETSISDNAISELSAKKVNLARGIKYLVFQNNKYKAYFILDEYNNIVDQDGKLPDGNLKIYDEQKELQEEFLIENNSIKTLHLYNKSITYKFDKNKKAIKMD